MQENSAGAINFEAPASLASLMKLSRAFPCLLLVAGLLASSPDFAGAQFSSNPGFDTTKLKAVNQLLADAVQRKEVPGAVVWLERNGKRWGNEFGRRAVDPEDRPMRVDTIFDAASLTKVMATTPSVMLLVEDGKVDLDAPASRYLPEFTGEGKEKITVRQLLTHVSGLKPGLLPGVPWEGYSAGVARTMTQEVKHAPGVEFRYSDLNFILLGEIVRRVSGETLAQFTLRRLYQPLSMHDTCFLPSALKKDRIAPTAREGAVVIHGVVHDPTSRLMGGVAGHAGLFSNARDTARFCRMLLAEGKSPDGRVIMKAETVRLMTTPQPPLPGGVRRTLGFDVLSAFSDPKGAHFGPKSYGHTGWTGTCFWIDPEANAFFVLMTNRNHPNEGKSVKTLRWQTSTLAAEAMGVARQVLSGTDLVSSKGLAVLEGKKIGLITNQTGLTTEGVPTLTVLQKITGAKVVRLFSPEHGIAGKLDHENIGDTIDEASGLPVTSLYGSSRKPPAESLAGVDVLVFDIQDIGTRFYTYISTMLNCMEAAAGANLPFVVMDRANPLGGIAVEGPLPIDVKNTFVACHNIPVRHGLTIGELAKLLVKERTPGLQLTVVPLSHWNRPLLFAHTLAPWVNPSPNMRSPDAALLYPGIGLLEFSNLSVGRGTDLPFTYVGAPWIDGPALERRLKEAGTAGVRVEAVDFTPQPDRAVPKGYPFNEQLCHGIRLTVTDAHQLRPVRLGIAIAQALHQQHGETYQLEKLNKLLFHPPTLQAIRDGKPLAEISALWASDETAFRLRRDGILIYPEVQP